MQRAQQYLIALSLLSLAAMPVIMALHFVISSEIAEHKIFEQLEIDECKTYIVPKQKVQWIKKGKELLINGKMFDIKSYTEDSINIKVTGLFDEAEDELKKKYRSFINNMADGGTDQLSFLNIFFIPFILHESEDEKMNACTIPDYTHHLYSEDAVKRASCVIKPPPQDSES